MDVHTGLYTGSDVDRILCLCWGSYCCSIVYCEVALFVHSCFWGCWHHPAVGVHLGLACYWSVPERIETVLFSWGMKTGVCFRVRMAPCITIYLPVFAACQCLCPLILLFSSSLHLLLLSFFLLSLGSVVATISFVRLASASLLEAAGSACSSVCRVALSVR